jgi:hypothetical protein
MKQLRIRQGLTLAGPCEHAMLPDLFGPQADAAVIGRDDGRAAMKTKTHNRRMSGPDRGRHLRHLDILERI